MSDIGQPFKATLNRITREYSLNLTALGAPAAKEINNLNNLNNDGSRTSPLIISTSDFLPDHLLELSLDGKVHLQIGNLSAGKVEVGPIVIPGQTPCYNCIALWKSEKNESLGKLLVAHKVATPLELPAASVTYLAGLIVSLVDSYLALNKSFLIGSSLVINLLKPLEYLERFWQPNPRCGCLELLS